MKYDGSMSAAQAAKMFASGEARAIGADGKPEKATTRKRASSRARTPALTIIEERRRSPLLVATLLVVGALSWAAAFMAMGS